MIKNEMTATASPLVGDALLEAISKLDSTTTVTEKCMACGYSKENGKADYVAFYTALIEAKGYNEPTEDPEMDEAEAELRDRYGDDAVDAFIEINGEDYLNHFEDAYQGEYESGAEFARQMIEDCHTNSLPYFVEIDWEATWQNLSYDYTEENGFIFSNNW